MLSIKVRAIIINRDGRCLRCGRTKNLVVDHVLPKSIGGSDDLSNLQTLCSKCNLWKGNRSAADFRPSPAAPEGPTVTYALVPRPGHVYSRALLNTSVSTLTRDAVKAHSRRTRIPQGRIVDSALEMFFANTPEEELLRADAPTSSIREVE